jgi:NADH:ubiquinone oxidoreductase subunit C
MRRTGHLVTAVRRLAQDSFDALTQSSAVDYLGENELEWKILRVEFFFVLGGDLLTRFQ